jgi:phosphopantetheine--protein transferase-like protein
VSLGNDVVDLADPEADLRELHPRFAERVFTATERDALAACQRSPAEADAARRTVLHWAFWAAKESAYKALKRLVPETVFAPREFEVTLPSVPPADGVGAAAGWVVHRGRRLSLEVRRSDEGLHAVAACAGTAETGIAWKLETAAGDPGDAVRRLAVREIATALDLDPAALSIVLRPPVVMHEGRPLEVDLSLAHHGRFVAFACALPQAAARQRGMLSQWVSPTVIRSQPSSAPPLSSP